LEDTKNHAAAPGIRLWFIPAGHRDELQPFDRAILGAMKAAFQRRFELQCRQHPQHRVTKSGAIQILTEIWDDLGAAAILGVWEIYGDDFGPDEDADGIDWEA
jgi:hypothetical protein